MPAINPVAVIAAAVVAMVIGGVYYLPALMGNRMMALAKVYVERAPSRAMAIQVVFTLVAMCALTVLVQLAGARDPVAGATGAFWAWLLLAFGRRGPNELLRAALVAVGHQPGELDHHVSRGRRRHRLLLLAWRPSLRGEEAPRGLPEAPLARQQAVLAGGLVRTHQTG